LPSDVVSTRFSPRATRGASAQPGDGFATTDAAGTVVGAGTEVVVLVDERELLLEHAARTTTRMATRERIKATDDI
jgi:hypothetical protein